MSRAPEVRKVVVLSTAHLSAATMNLLGSTPIPDWPVAGACLPFGFYVYAHDEDGGDDPIPADLWACCVWANANGFDYIQFDADADTLAALETFEHGSALSYADAMAWQYGASAVAELRVMVNEASIAGAYNAPHVSRARELLAKIDGPPKN